MLQLELVKFQVQPLSGWKRPIYKLYFPRLQNDVYLVPQARIIKVVTEATLMIRS